MTRKPHLLHAHGLIAKIPRSRRWRVIAKGAAVIGAAIHYRERALPEEMMKLDDEAGGLTITQHLREKQTIHRGRD